MAVARQIAAEQGRDGEPTDRIMYHVVRRALAAVIADERERRMNEFEKMTYLVLRGLVAQTGFVCAKLPGWAPTREDCDCPRCVADRTMRAMEALEARERKSSEVPK